MSHCSRGSGVPRSPYDPACRLSPPPVSKADLSFDMPARREQQAYEKKIRKAKAKSNADLAQRLATRRPTYTLDRLVKERQGAAHFAVSVIQQAHRVATTQRNLSNLQVSGFCGCPPRHGRPAVNDPPFCGAASRAGVQHPSASGVHRTTSLTQRAETALRPCQCQAE